MSRIRAEHPIGDSIVATALSLLAAIPCCIWGGFALGCAGDADGTDGDAGVDAASVEPGLRFPTVEWEISTPEAEGMDAAMLEEARAYAFADAKHTQGVVVIRHGKIVAEWYADDHGPDSWAASWSMAKSFAATLVGIAIDEALVSGVDVSMSDYFPEWKSDARAEITLEHVLHMESGLDWVEDYAPGSVDSDVATVFISTKDVLSYVLKRELAVPPGTRFNYSSGDTMLLSGMLEQVTGMSAGEYAQQKLFEPLGIAPVEWWTDVAGRTLTWCCLDMPSRQFAKLGLLYMHGGTWDGDPIVSRDWVDAALKASEVSDGQYGYQIWTSGQAQGTWLPTDTFELDGFDGQFVYAIPSLDLIAVRNGRYIKKEGEPVADPSLLNTYPSQGLSDTLGTEGPDVWNAQKFLGPIIEAIQD